MISWLFSPVGRILGGAGAVLLFLVTFGASQQRKGANKVKIKAKEADHERAEEIREATDDAIRANDADERNVDERLQSRGRLRD